MRECDKNLVRVTVIVTVHNAEKYLKECLDSVTTQTLQEIEILCMDGGSTDASPQILREYALKDKRVRIINDPNTSYGHKVNEGIRQASGEYIAVLESDDMYRPDMLERLYEVVGKYHPDYVNADYLEFRDVDERRYFSLVKMYEAGAYGSIIESGKYPEYMVQILRYWTGIFRKEFLLGKEIWMNESPGASFQDMSFRFLTSALADTCFHLELPVYLYRADNPNSSVHDPKKVAVITDEFKFLERELHKRKVENACIWRQYYIWKYNDFYGNLVRFDNAARKDLFERCYHELSKDRMALLQIQEHNQPGCPKSIHELLTREKGEVWQSIEEAYQENKKGEYALWNMYRKIADKKLVIFGCGRRGKSLYNLLYSVHSQIVCYTDNAEKLWGRDFCGFPVLSPTDAVQRYPNAFYLIANKHYAGEIFIQLLEFGIVERNICKL